MTAQEPATKTYGKLDVSIAEDTYEAGRRSLVSLVIRNPFDVPIIVTEIEAPRSTRLTDNINSEEGGVFHSIKMAFRRDIAVSLNTGVGGPDLRAEFAGQRQTVNIRAEKGAEIIVDRDLTKYETINIVAAEESKIELPRLVSQGMQQIINPHCEAVSSFSIKSAGWLLFKPTRLVLHGQIKYLVDGRELSQVVSCNIDMKPPLRSVIFGTVAGAALGTLARFAKATTFDPRAIAVALGASALTSLIASVALSRKTGTQGFITIEDFFGGFVVGALIGYGGGDFFDQIMTKLQQDATPIKH
jgi:hypothetical protein